MEKSKKSQRRSLYFGAFSLLLCVVMLLGTTLAWFTDSIVSGNNRIMTGNLKIGAEWSDAAPSETEWRILFDPYESLIDGNEIWSMYAENPNYVPHDVDGFPHLFLLNGDKPADSTWYNPADWSPLNEDTMIMEELFEPNKSGAKYIRAYNDGSSTLPADIFLEISFQTANINPDGSYVTDEDGNIIYTTDFDVAKLTDVLKFQINPVMVSGDDVRDSSTYAPMPAPTPDEWYEWPTLGNMIAGNKIYIDSRDVRPYGVGGNDGIVFRLDYMMCPWAGNTYQNKAVVASVSVVAVQHNTYDYNFNPFGATGEEEYGTENIFFAINNEADLWAAQAALAKNPGMTWIFTNDLIMSGDPTDYLALRELWANLQETVIVPSLYPEVLADIVSYGADWEIMGTSVSTYGSFAIDLVNWSVNVKGKILDSTWSLTADEIAEFAVYDAEQMIPAIPQPYTYPIIISNPVNIDLNGFTWDVSMYEGLVFEFLQTPCAVEIANGTILFDMWALSTQFTYKAGDAVIVVNLTDTLSLNFGVEPDDEDMFKINDDSIPINE